MHLHWFDYAVIAIVGLSVLTGLFRGFVKELVALSVWIVAIWLSVNYAQIVSTWFEAYIHDKTARVALAFLAILIITLICGALVNALLSFLLNRSGLSGTDRILGMGFGLVRGIFLVALIILAARMTSISFDSDNKKSFFYQKWEPLVNWMYGYTPDFIKKIHVMDKTNAVIDITPGPG